MSSFYAIPTINDFVIEQLAFIKKGAKGFGYLTVLVESDTITEECAFVYSLVHD